MSPASERIAANVAWLFTEHPWPDRFSAARDAGFVAVEFPWPADPEATADAVRQAGVRVALLNVDAGDLAAGDRGWANDPSRGAEWRSSFDAALWLAGSVGCPTVNVLAGNRVVGAPAAAQVEALEANLEWALPRASGVGVTVVTEILNRRENPEYLFGSLDDVDPLLRRFAPLGWKLQLDTWHLGIEGSDVPAAIRRAGRNIGHVQVADVPGRHEPGTGDLDWHAIGAALRAVRYRGSIGLEYVPSSSEMSLDTVTRLIDATT